MENKVNIFGCFVAGPSFYHDDSEILKELGKKKGSEFREYIWGEKGISKILNELQSTKYGIDLKLILFQFHINPIPYLRVALKDIENYRKSEKSIGVSIIIDDNNFFNKNEELRFQFLACEIDKRIDLIENLVKKKKLDTDVKLLKKDFEIIRTKILHF